MNGVGARGAGNTDATGDLSPALREALAAAEAATASSGPRTIYLPPWRIEIICRPGVERLLPDSVLARTIARALSAAGAPEPGSVALILSDDSELADLNLEHLGVEGPTDVLSFPLLPPEAFPQHPRANPVAIPDEEDIRFVLPPGRRVHVGDIIVSVERAVAQATAGRGGQTGDAGGSPEDELLLLVTHGTLHLCGWDHAEPVEGEAMRALERYLLAIRQGGAES